MRFRKFVQSGNYKQSTTNGMDPYVYSFGASFGNRESYAILTEDGVSSEYWSIQKEYATPFKLELVFDDWRNDDIPF